MFMGWAISWRYFDGTGNERFGLDYQKRVKTRLVFPPFQIDHGENFTTKKPSTKVGGFLVSGTGLLSRSSKAAFWGCFTKKLKNASHFIIFNCPLF